MATFKSLGSMSQMSTTTMLSPEIWLQIINHLPPYDLLNLCKSHRVFYDLAIQKLYYTIHFIDPAAEVDSVHKLLFDKEYSSAIYNLPNFIRTLGSSTSIQSFVSCASFSWESELHAAVKPDVSTILTMIGKSLKRLHYAPPTWDYVIPRLYSATSVCMPLPKSSGINLKETLHSLFTLPTLNGVALCQLYNTFTIDNNFKPWEFPLGTQFPPYRPDKSKKQSSNIKCLSIQRTKLQDLDNLAEIMLWPKALKAFECTLADTSNCMDEYPHDASQFAHMLQPQSASLEQIILHCVNTSLSYLGTFGTSLRQFPMLKRISMPRNFLTRFTSECVGYTPCYQTENDYMHASMEHLHLALPPALEELILNVDSEFYSLELDEHFPVPQVRERMWEMVLNTEKLLPYLRRMVLWRSCRPGEHTTQENAAMEKRILGWLQVSQDFEIMGVEFDYKVTEVAPEFKNPFLVF